MDQFWPAAHQFLVEGMTRNTKEEPVSRKILAKMKPSRKSVKGEEIVDFLST